MRGQFRLFLSLVSVLVALPSYASALSLTSEGGYEFDVSTTDGTMTDGTVDTYDSCYSLNLTIAGRTTRYNAGTASPVMSLDGRQIELPEVAVGTAMASRWIYVPSTDGNYARYLDIITNPTSGDMPITINIAGNMGSDSSTIVYADSSGDNVADVSDAWFGTDDSMDGGGDTAAAHVFQGVSPRERATSVTRSNDNIGWNFFVTIPAGGRVAVLTFALQNNSRTDAAAEAASLADPSDQALTGLDEEVDDIINFSFAIPGAPRVVFTSASTADEGDEIAVTAEVTDLEGDPVTFSWDTDDDGTFGELTGMTSYTISGDSTDGPAQRRVGITATDGTNSITRYRSISIRNVAPVITSEATVTLTGIDADYQYPIVAHDAAGTRDPLTYAVVTGPEHMSVSATGVVSWIPTSRDVTSDGHPIHIVVSVSDGDEGTTTQEWDVDVLATHAPTNPTPVYPVENGGVRETMPRLVVQNSSDADLDTVRYQFQIDTVATFDSAALQDSDWVDEGTALSFWYVATPLEAGYYYWRVRASDGTLNTVWRTSHFYVVPDHVDPPDMGVTDLGMGTVDMTVVTPPPVDDGGCNVGHGASDGSRGAWLALALIALVFVWRNRSKSAGVLTLVVALLSAGSAHAQDASGGAAVPPSTSATDSSLTDTQDELDSDAAMPPPVDTSTDALAEPVDATNAPADPARPADSLSHRHQVGIRFGAGMGGLYAVKYGSGPACSDNPAESTCRRAGVPTLDLDLSFGISDAVEISALARFGLSENIASNAKPLVFGLGVRAYSNQHGMFKLFVGGRVMLDIQSSSAPNWHGVDFGARGEFGFNVDFIRWAGVYVQLGAGIQVLNGLYFVGDATGGVQARFP